MGELDPRIEKVRRVGIGVFIALSIAAIPIGIHIVRSYESPELWLTLLGAVFMLVLICLYALETALAPIPKPKTHSPFVVDSEDKTQLDESENETVLDESEEETLLDEEDDEVDPDHEERSRYEEKNTEFEEPRVEITPIDEPSATESAILVEVEEVPTHPPFTLRGPGALEDQLTEPDSERLPLRNPDAPIMMVPSTLVSADGNDGDDA